MTDISKWIDKTIHDLVNPDLKLKDILLKVQVLAFKLDNENLKQWVEKELNGYDKDEDVADYRKIESAVFGNLVQDRGYGNFLSHNKYRLPIELLDEKYSKLLVCVKLTSSVSEIEEMLEKNTDYGESIPAQILPIIQKALANEWRIESAWKSLTKPLLEKALSSIKSNLLNFLLELNKNVGNNENYSILEGNDNIDSLYSKTIGNITGETINLTIGDNSVQTNNSGNDSHFNIAHGKNIEQNIDATYKNNLKELIEYLNTNIENLSLNKEDKEDVESEVKRIEKQIKKEAPRLSIINSGLETVKGILLGVATNAYTPIILEKIKLLTGG